MTPWPSGIKVREQLIQLPVTVEKVTESDITLCGRTVLGGLHGVDAVFPLPPRPGPG